MSELTGAVEERLGEIEELHDELIRELDQAEEDAVAMVAESRSTDEVFDWLADVVREAEGQMIDGVAPGVILARLVNELSDQRSFNYRNELPLAV